MTVELVPSSVWNSSLYRLLPIDEWNAVRNEIISKTGRKCQICGETAGAMNLHEKWKYDDNKHVQKLVGFALLCRMCHHVKHIGLAGILADEGKLNYEKLTEHFCKVNNCSEEEFELHANRAFEIWRKRSKHRWNQDFGKYEEFIRR